MPAYALLAEVSDRPGILSGLTRVLADHHYLHTRYYGSEQQTDFHVS